MYTTKIAHYLAQQQAKKFCKSAENNALLSASLFGLGVQRMLEKTAWAPSMLSSTWYPAIGAAGGASIGALIEYLREKDPEKRQWLRSILLGGAAGGLAGGGAYALSRYLEGDARVKRGPGAYTSRPSVSSNVGAGGVGAKQRPGVATPSPSASSNTGAGSACSECGPGVYTSSPSASSNAGAGARAKQRPGAATSSPSASSNVGGQLNAAATTTSDASNEQTPTLAWRPELDVSNSIGRHPIVSSIVAKGSGPQPSLEYLMRAAREGYLVPQEREALVKALAAYPGLNNRELKDLLDAIQPQLSPEEIQGLMADIRSNRAPKGSPRSTTTTSDASNEQTPTLAWRPELDVSNSIGRHPIVSSIVAKGSGPQPSLEYLMRAAREGYLVPQEREALVKALAAYPGLSYLELKDLLDAIQPQLSPEEIQGLMADIRSKTAPVNNDIDKKTTNPILMPPDEKGMEKKPSKALSPST